MTRHRYSVVFSLLLSCNAFSDTLSVAVASNFASAMTELTAEFEQESGHQLTVTLGASGKIATQIQNGAPFQVFLSADQAKPEALEANGLTIPGTRFTYATGTLALWSATAGLIDEHAAVLTQNQFSKLAIANPRLAPYGAAAMEVLAHFGLVDTVRPKLVQGENIAQTYQFVATGNAPLGFVALSQIMKNGKLTHGSAWIVPAVLHAPIHQDAVLLKKGENSLAAQAFLSFIRSTKAQAIISSYGYQSSTQ